MSRYEPLRFEEREIISRELGKDRSARFIAITLGRHHSTIDWEIDLHDAVNDGLQEKWSPKQIGRYAPAGVVMHRTVARATRTLTRGTVDGRTVRTRPGYTSTRISSE